jgi:hypothetical protein
MDKKCGRYGVQKLGASMFGDYNMLVFLVIFFHCSFSFGVPKGYVELFLMHP